MTSASSRRPAARRSFALALVAALAATACSGSKDAAPSLTRLDVTPPAPTLPRGAALQLRATAVWSSGAPQDVGSVATWTTSNAAVASVAGGLVTGLATGSATITATWSGQVSAVALTVTPAALVAVAVDPPAAAVPAGTRRAFTATGVYTDGTTADLTASAAWTSSAPAALATTATPGEARGAAAGAATLTATQDGHHGQAAVTVTAPALVSLRVEPSAATAPLGLSTTFTATGVYSDDSTADLTAEVLWAAEGGLAVFPSGSPAGTATGLTVGGPGVVRALLPGSAVSGQATLTVTDAVPVSLDVAPGAATLAAGLTRAFVATAVFSDGRHADVTSQALWTAAPAALATVSTAPATAGQVSALAPGGPVTIEASLPGSGISGSATLTVAAAAVAAVDVAPATASLAAGRTQAFTAEAVLTDGRRLPATDDATWSSSDPGLAPVSNAAGTRGVATGLRAGGPVTISARLPGAAAAGAAALTVTPADLVGLAIEPATLSLAAGTGGRLLATGLFSDGTRADLTGAVTWTSAAPATAAVGTGAAGAGVVSAVAPGGPVTVTATLPGGGPQATASVTVTPAVLVGLELSPAAASVALGRSAAFTATGVFSDGRRQDLTAQVSWLSTDVAVATVSNARSSAGVAQSRGEGTAELVAWFPGTAVTAAATLTVTPPEVVSIALSPATLTAPAGRLVRFSAAGTYTDGVVRDVTAAATWSSSAPATAAVTAEKGELRAVAPGGPVTVTAALAGVTGSAALTVGPAVLDAIAVSPAATSLLYGEAVDLTATGTYSDGAVRDVTAAAAWTSAPAGLVLLQPVPGAERATGRGLGAAVVTAALDGISGDATVSVAPVLPDQVVVVPGVARTGLDQHLQLRAFGAFGGGQLLEITGAVTWTVSEPGVLDPQALPGLYLAMMPGQVTVTATLGASGSAAVTVTDQPFTPALAALRIDGAATPLGVGGLAQLRAQGLREDGVALDVTADVAWSTAEPVVATVDATGLARGVAAGTTTVTAAHAASGLSASAALGVAAAPVPSALAVRVAPRVPAGVVVQAVALGQDAGGGEVDLTGVVQWFGLGGARSLGGGRFLLDAPGGRVAAVWGEQVVLADVTALGPEAASAYRILPGDATLAPADPGGLDAGLLGLATFVAVLSFDGAEPAEVVAGACTDDGDLASQCAFDFFMGAGTGPGCELACFGGQGATVCLPTAPTTRTITCTAGGRTATATATVTHAPHAAAPAGLLIRPAGWSAQPPFGGPDLGLTKDFQGQPVPPLHPGEAAELEAVAVWDDATFLPTAAAWATGDPRVGAVEAPGRIRAGAPGVTVVQASALAFTATTGLTVVPAGQAGSAIVLQGPARLDAGGLPAEYLALDGGGADVTAQVVWRSSDPAVAAFDPAAPGVLQPLAAGSTTVTATSRQGFSSSLEVTVVGVVGLDLYPTRPVVQAGQVFNPIALIRYSDGSLGSPQQQLSWWVDDPNVLFLDFGSGGFVGNQPGFTVLHAELPGFAASVPVVVDFQGSTELDSVVVFPVAPLAVGQVARPEAWSILRDGSFFAADASYTFASADPAVAAPAPGDPMGLVAVGPGATTWTVTAPGGAVSGSTPVTVYELASITLTPAAPALAVGQAAVLEATGVDTMGQRHRLTGAAATSSDPSVAAVGAGDPLVVSALSEGTATVTVTFAGVSATAAVTVGPAYPIGLRLAPSPVVLEVGTRGQVRVLVALTDGTEVDVTAQATLRTLDAAVAALPSGEAAGTVEGVAIGRGALLATFAANGHPVSAVANVQVIPVITHLFVEAFPPDAAAGEDVEVFAGAFLQDGGLVDLTGSTTFASDDTAVLAPRPLIAHNVFHAAAEGVATVTGTLPSGASGTTQVFVRPAEPVFLEITPAAATGVVGQEVAFRAMATMTDGTVRDVTDAANWDAGGPASQVRPGVFVPSAGGTFNVMAFMFGPRGEVFASAVLEVPHVFLGFELQPVTQPLLQGMTAAFTATGLRDDGARLEVTAVVTWTVDRADAAVVAPGQLRFDGTGGYRILVSDPAGPATGELFVEVVPAPVSLTLSPGSASVTLGSDASFFAEVAFSDGTVLDVTNDPTTTWQVVDGALGVLVFPGTFRGVDYGTTEVVATWSYAGVAVEGRATFTVVPYVVGGRLTPVNATVPVGGTATFQTFHLMSDGSEVEVTAETSWASSDTSVAAVTSPGQVLGLAAGFTAVHAFLPGGASATAGLTVFAP